MKFFSVLLGVVIFVIILVLTITTLILEKFVDPAFKGFFCNDISIRYPLFNEETVPDWSLYVIVITLPLVVIVCDVLLKFYREWFTARSGSESVYSAPRDIVKYHLLTGFLWFGSYLMGIGLTVIVTTIIKISYGGLRPYFMQACDVDFTKINCTDEYGLPVYVTNYTCRGDISDVREARLSFPSGHASTSAYSMLFVALYISLMVIVYTHSHLQFSLVIVFGILFPSLIGLTRINDNRHHPHDVIMGAMLGAAIALIVVYFHFNFLKDHVKKESKEKHVMMDTENDDKNTAAPMVDSEV